MQALTPAGDQLVHQLASRYRLSRDTVLHMLIAVNQGGGTMAQFNAPELGGSGQWMQGGMTMVGDMFNHGLKATVDNLCTELSRALATTQIFPPVPPPTHGPGGFGSSGWPAELGQPSSSGSQNNLRYAVFPQVHRLALAIDGQISLYDTLNHHIGGVSQQQGGGLASLSFSSQFGSFTVASLPLVSGPGHLPPPPPVFHPSSAPQPPQPPPAPMPAAPFAPSAPLRPAGGANSQEVIDLLAKLGQLRDGGVLTDAEFNQKKAELLQRL